MSRYGFKLALAHDNVAGLVGLHQIAPPLFKHYWDGDLQVRYFPSEARERDGNRAWRRIGRPYAALVLDGITGAERALLRSTFYGSADQCDVTVQIYNTDEERWMVCNGTLERPDPDSDEEPMIGGWRSLRLYLYDLVEIPSSSAFDSGFDAAAFGPGSGSSDTVRSLSALLALFPDNTTEEIIPQDVRDLIKSAMGYRRIRTVTASEVLTSEDDFVLVNVSTTGQVITLPAAADCVGQTITVKRLNATNNFTVVPPTGTIEGSASFTFSAQWRSKSFRSTGSAWLYAIGNASAGGW